VQGLSGRVAVVTGASRGIGRAVAIALAGQGAKVIVNFQHNEAAAGQTVATIGGAGGEAVAMRFDVADAAAVEAAMKEVTATCGGIQILVNNAGGREPGRNLQLHACGPALAHACAGRWTRHQHRLDHR
jgi:3-oxoacyl-[acyl-carrier protein] reductase